MAKRSFETYINFYAFLLEYAINHYGRLPSLNCIVKHDWYKTKSAVLWAFDALTELGYLTRHEPDGFVDQAYYTINELDFVEEIRKEYYKRKLYRRNKERNENNERARQTT